MLLMPVLMVMLQIESYALPQEPQVQYRFIATEEHNTPVAECDAQFNCHCPAGYKAVVRQAAASSAATSVACEPLSASQQVRETFDSYPVLPTRDNFGK